MNVFNTIVGTLKPDQTQQQQQDLGQQQQEEAPWLLVSAARAVGSIAGAVSCICGFFLILDIFNVTCIFSGAMLIIEGFLMILTEAPCCCVFFEFAYMPSTLLNNRPAWIKATIYLFFAAIPFFWCTGVSTFFACGLIMVTSAIYLLISLGKKAQREEMLAKSSAGMQTTATSNNGSNNMMTTTTRSIPTAPTSVLVQNEELPIPTGPMAMGTMKPNNNNAGFGQNQVLY